MVDSKVYEPLWLENAIPLIIGKPTKCSRFASSSSAVQLMETECPASGFNRSNVIGCNGYVYKTDEISILNNVSPLKLYNIQYLLLNASLYKQFHLECDDDAAWKLAMVGIANNLGRFIFMPIMGLFSDRLGRRTILIVGVFGSSVFAYIRSIAPNYLTFVLFEFLDAGIGSCTYSASFILALEWIGVKDRVLLGSIVTATYPFGQIFLGLTARAVHDYRRLLQIIYAPGFLILLYVWIAPESIRWLIVNQKKKQVLSTLSRAEKMNGLKLSQNTVDRINIEITETIKMKSNDAIDHNEFRESKLQQFLMVFKKNTFLIRFLICAFAWLTSAFVSYGISLTSIALAGDKYINFVVIAIAGKNSNSSN